MYNYTITMRVTSIIMIVIVFFITASTIDGFSSSFDRKAAKNLRRINRYYRYDDYDYYDYYNHYDHYREFEEFHGDYSNKSILVRVNYMIYGISQMFMGIFIIFTIIMVMLQVIQQLT
jgi:hypothetical protein